MLAELSSLSVTFCTITHSTPNLTRTRSLVCDLNHARSIARVLVINLDILDIAQARPSASAIAQTIAHAHDLEIAMARTSGSANDLSLDLIRVGVIASGFNNAIRAIIRDLDRNLDIIRNLDIAIFRNRNLDLSEADLSGANLRDINLTRVDLTRADLTYADVMGTIFGDNPGLTEADKRDLQSRGAIFLDPPSSDVPVLVLR